MLDTPSASEPRVLRETTQADFGDILRLNSDWVRYTSALDHVALARLHELAAYHKVIELGGRVVAFLLALREGVDYASPNYLWFAERGGTYLYVDRVIVDQQAQGSGLATELYDDLFSFAKSQSVPHVVCELDVEPPNEASRRFHDTFGFREVGTQWVAEGTKRVSLRQADVD